MIEAPLVDYIDHSCPYLDVVLDRLVLPQPRHRKGERPLNPREFFNAAMAGRFHLNPLAVTAQAVVETGWFSKLIAPHNYAGIKWRADFAQFGAKPQEAVSGEFKGGRFVRQPSVFASFPSLDAFLRAYDWKMTHQKNYAVARDNADCVWGFLAGLFRGGWATDPDYFAKLARVAAHLSGGLLGSEVMAAARLRSALSLATSRNVLLPWMPEVIESAMATAFRRAKKGGGAS